MVKDTKPLLVLPLDDTIIGQIHSTLIIPQWIVYSRKTYCIQDLWGKLLCFEWEMVICDETFAVTFLLTYIADRQAMIHREWFAIEWKTAKATEVFPHGSFAVYGNVMY